MLGTITHGMRDRISLSVPLALTRSWLCIFSLGVALVAVLLPLANISYMKFYNSLIPEASPRIPIKPISYNLNTTRWLGHPLTVDLVQFWQNHPYQFDRLLDYEWNLHLDVYCKSYKNGEIFKVPYKIVHKTYHGDVTLLESSFILDCDSRYIHHSNNRLIPFNLRFWAPPAMVDIGRSLKLNLRKLVLSGKTLAEIRTIQVQVSSDNFWTNDDNTYLQLLVKFSGFRYYLVEHFYLCYILGVGILWLNSSVLCLLMSSYVLFSEEDDEEERAKLTENEQ